MESPKNSHYKVGKIILRFFIGTIDYIIMYLCTNGSILVGYIERGFGGSINYVKNTFNYAFDLGLGLIS